VTAAELGRAALVVNPGARGGAARAEEARDHLLRLGVPLAATHLLERPESAAQVLRDELSRGARLLVIGGGDGTVATAAGILAGTPCALAVLPLGTANDFARTLRLPVDLEAACAVAANGEPRPVDVACAGTRPFLNAASVGLSTRVTRRLTRELKRRAGPLAYPIAASGEALDPRPFRLRLVVDGVRHELDSLQLVVGNGRYHGGGRLLAPEARIDDRRLHAWAVRAATPEGAGRSGTDRLQDVVRLARLAFLIARGRHLEHSEVEAWEGRAFSVETDPPLEIDADGELAGRTPREFALAPERVRVMTPRR
jgi:YegS/Rv2252/BmrU family lipid kinase